MSFGRLIWQSIRYHRRAHLALFAGTFMVCAVLSGALVVGDSVRRTLYGIAEARLGKATHALDWGNRYFDRALADAITERQGAGNGYEDYEAVARGATDEVQPDRPAIAAVLGLRGVVELPPGGPGDARRINRAWVYGVDPQFWALAPESAPPPPIGPQEALVNEATARELGVHEGDAVLLRIPRPSVMPMDAPLARGGDSDTAVVRVQVVGVLTEAQWGRFSLSTDQAMPANLFVDQRWLGDWVGLSGKANLLLAREDPDADRLQETLSKAWRLDMVGLQLREHPSGVIQLESERVFLEPVLVEAAQQAADAQPTLTYLVSRISAGDRATPYSFVTAGAVPADMPNDAVCINQWLADALQVAPGDVVDIAWSAPLASGDYVERQASAPVHCVIGMEELQTERDLAPQFPGLSDVDSCRDWDIGLPLDDEQLLDEANEAYWKAYGQTPKLMTHFDTGSAWWGSRYGTVTALRFSAADPDIPPLEQRLRDAVDVAELGLVFMPVRDQAMQAVEQALDFGMLFAGMSMFLIVAALVLLGLLHAHGLQQRAGEMGVLLAMGWPRGRLGAWRLVESLPALTLGAITGAPGGAVYARMLIHGLIRFWPEAVAGTPLRYHASFTAMAQGITATIGCVLVVIGAGVLRAGRRPARELLARDFTSTPLAAGRHNRYYALAAGVALLAVVASLFQAFREPEGQPTAWFFISGAAMLTAALAAWGVVLGRLEAGRAPRQPRLWRILLSQLARRRTRSLGVAAVIACGVFMVVSVAAMQAAMTFEPEQPQSGAGGFTVFAVTTLPVRGGEEGLPGYPRDQVLPLRVWDGDDAGCLNLNHALRPRLYGVEPAALIARQAFAPPDEVEALWSLLETDLDDDVVPALVGDTDTALWGLQATIDRNHGTEIVYRDDAGRPFRVRTIGRLPMRLSLFQGALLISEEHFTRLFPHEGGYRGFLVEAADARKTAAELNRQFGRLGMEAQPSIDRLRAFHAVERAYLAMFLVLGGLGMTLGAGGAAVIVLRNLAERRGEFALLVAVGYEPGRVRCMALIENMGLVAAGIFFGLGAAALATAPLLFKASTELNRGALLLVCVVLAAAYLAAVAVSTKWYLARIPLSALRTE